MNTIFSFPIRVYYEDTDAGGVVYHSRYLNFMERARTEWLRSLGFEQDELRRSHGVLFAVSSLSIDFRRPARFNELLAVTVAVQRRGAASLQIAQEVRRGAEMLASAEVRIACLDAERFAPTAIPPHIAARVGTAAGQPRRATAKETS